MNDVKLIKKIISLKDGLEFQYLAKYHKNKTKIQTISSNLAKIDEKINDYEKINWLILISKEIDYVSHERELDKLKIFYLKNNIAKIEHYNFLNLINEFQDNWDDYSKSTMEQQKFLFYTNIAKYKAYLQYHDDSNQKNIEDELLNVFNYFKNIKKIINEEKENYIAKELKKYHKLKTLIMLNANKLLKSGSETDRLRSFLIETHLQSYTDKNGWEAEINWIKNPIDSFKEGTQLEKLSQYFTYVGIEKFKENKKFYDSVVNNKTLIKEQLGIALLKIFDVKLNTTKNYDNFRNLVYQEVFKKYELCLEEGNEQMDIKGINNLVKEQLFF